MNTIHILPHDEAQKIAAGEIVERPANIVKELLENALDAGATRITLSIEDGGKQLIRITDNGSGMNPEDARLSIVRHATSKIRSIKDLESIATFGFRGEALAAIAAVSKMKLMTKQEDTLSGIDFTIEHGVIINEKVCALQTGTTIEARDLFFNIPARQKFLKKKETECRHIADLFQAFCLAHPTVHATFISDGSISAQYTPVQTIYERCQQILQKESYQNLVAIDTHNDAITVTGAVSDHQWYRYDRSGIFLFVNGRWITNQSCIRALIRAYNNVIPHGKYPVGALMLSIKPNTVDVNVHPRKQEVQFEHPYRIEKFIQQSIHDALSVHSTRFIETSVSITPHLPYLNAKETPHHFKPLSYRPLQSFSSQNIPTSIHVAPTINASPKTIPQQKSFSIADQSHIQYNTDEQVPYILIGQFQKTYLLVESSDGLVIIDQHAAHESVLYERFLESHQSTSVSLLFPELIYLSDADFALVEPYLSLLHQHGIENDLFGASTLRITAVPVHLKQVPIESLIKTIIHEVHEIKQHLTHDDIHTVINKKLCAQMACKAAVKSGDQLDDSTMQQLIKDLHATKQRLTCPHGRPTSWLISRYELDKKFKRVAS